MLLIRLICTAIAITSTAATPDDYQAKVDPEIEAKVDALFNKVVKSDPNHVPSSNKEPDTWYRMKKAASVSDDEFMINCKRHLKAVTFQDPKAPDDDSGLALRGSFELDRRLHNVNLNEDTDANGNPHDCKKILEGQKARRRELAERSILATNKQSPSASSKIDATPTTPKLKASNKPNDFSGASRTNFEGANESELELRDIEGVKSDIDYFARKNAAAAVKRSDDLVKQTRSDISGLKRKAAIEDQRLAYSAKSSISEGKRFSDESANRAHDRKVKNHLLVVSSATNSKPVLEKEEARVTGQLAELLKLAGITSKLGDNMSTVSPSASSISAANKNGEDPAAALSENESAAKRAEKEAGSRKASAEKNAGSIAAAEKEAAQAAAEAAASAEAEKNSKDPKKNRGSSLRDQITSLLKQRQNEAISGSAQFQEELPSDQINASGASATPPSESGFRNILSESIRAAKEDTGFSMRNAEAEAKQFVADSEGHMNGLSEGILAVESSPLFERVTLAYQACLRRKCL